MNMCNFTGLMGETAKKLGAGLLNCEERGGKASVTDFSYINEEHGSPTYTTSTPVCNM